MSQSCSSGKRKGAINRSFPSKVWSIVTLQVHIGNRIGLGHVDLDFSAGDCVVSSARQSGSCNASPFSVWSWLALDPAYDPRHFFGRSIRRLSLTQCPSFVPFLSHKQLLCILVSVTSSACASCISSCLGVSIRELPSSTDSTFCVQDFLRVRATKYSIPKSRSLYFTTVRHPLFVCLKSAILASTRPYPSLKICDWASPTCSFMHAPPSWHLHS
jgi:hypothetical protein